MVKITETGEVSPYEKSALKGLADFLMVGKQDKSIKVISGGKEIPIKELPISTRSGTYDGELEIKTEEGLSFFIKFGRTTVDANTTKTVTFTKPFPNRAFQTHVTANNNVADTSRLTSSTGTATEFTITSSGGTLTNIVSWFAFGF